MYNCIYQDSYGLTHFEFAAVYSLTNDSEVAIATVPLNYNFIFTRVNTRGATQYFAC